MWETCQTNQGMFILCLSFIPEFISVKTVGVKLKNIPYYYKENNSSELKLFKLKFQKGKINYAGPQSFKNLLVGPNFSTNINQHKE